MKPFTTPIALYGLIILFTHCISPKTNDTSTPACTVTQDGCTSFPAGRCGICADTTNPDNLCAYLPRDVDVSTILGYGQFEPNCQKPFDWFSWQSFVSLNWPADENGIPLKKQIGSSPNAKRVWESYVDLGEIFGSETKTTHQKLLKNITKGGDLTFNGPIDDQEAVVHWPLIDRNLNYVLFEVKVNEIEKKYIIHEGLNNYCGQKKFQGEISFPIGRYPDKIGSMELKAAWRILIPSLDDTSRYYHTRAVVQVPAEYTTNRQTITDTVMVGLVGFHMIRRVNADNNGNGWIWSSFEHIDNAPDCPDSVCANTADPYSFYNPQCSSCVLNKPPSLGKDAQYLWSPRLTDNPQYARRYATDKQYGTQVARINPIEASTQTINQTWQGYLKGTVWSNYKLIGSQWLNPEVPRSGLPEKQANSVLETYLQTLDMQNGSGSCVTCHSFARTSFGQVANFSFLLSIPDSTGCD